MSLKDKICEEKKKELWTPVALIDASNSPGVQASPKKKKKINCYGIRALRSDKQPLGDFTVVVVVEPTSKHRRRRASPGVSIDFPVGWRVC